MSSSLSKPNSAHSRRDNRERERLAVAAAGVHRLLGLPTGRRVGRESRRAAVSEEQVAAGRHGGERGRADTAAAAELAARDATAALGGRHGEAARGAGEGVGGEGLGGPGAGGKETAGRGGVNRPLAGEAAGGAGGRAAAGGGGRRAGLGRVLDAAGGAGALRRSI